MCYHTAVAKAVVLKHLTIAAALLTIAMGVTSVRAVAEPPSPSLVAPADRQIHHLIILSSLQKHRPPATSFAQAGQYCDGYTQCPHCYYCNNSNYCVYGYNPQDGCP
jgi:hypothetical protein